MDYHKFMRERRQAFFENPRASIKTFIEHVSSSTKGYCELPMVKAHPEMLILFKQVHLEYANLIGVTLSKLSGHDLLNDSNLIGTAQRNQETIATYIDCTKEVNEVNAIRLARCFSAYQELIWKKLKMIVRVAGLNPKNSYLTINSVKEKIEKIEESFGVDATTIKEYITANLRNSVGHEDTVFVSPDIISFEDSKGGKTVVVARLSVDKIKYKIAEFTSVLGAMTLVEQTAIAAKMEPLLKLPDDKLAEYMKTGIITDEMDKIIASKS